jgi:hypothetical protein
VITWPSWLKPDARVWIHQTESVVGRIDERGLVLEQRRRGQRPMRRLLNPQELADVLESGALRPYNQRIA